MVMYYLYRQNQAVRYGKWFAHRASGGEVELYDLESDPCEAHPANEQYPDVVDRMLAEARAYEAEIPKVWSLQYPVRDPNKRKSGVRTQ